MRRWILRILLCLILLTGGAITTVAVAWACIEFSPRAIHTWDVGPGWIEVQLQGVGFTEAHFQTSSTSEPEGRVLGGLPMLALVGFVQVPSSSLGGTVVERGEVKYPLLPIWPGFGIDTLFYGAIWGGVWFGFVGGKRLIRIKRGRCPRCGYDLRGNLSAGCSECGWGRTEQAE